MIVSFRQPLTDARPLRKMAQLHRENRRLQAVEPTVDALDFVIALLERAVPRVHRQPARQIAVVRHDSAGISNSTEVLSGIERKSSDIPEGAHEQPTITLQERLL